jgi:hypothetical protein
MVVAFTGAGHLVVPVAVILTDCGRWQLLCHPTLGGGPQRLTQVITPPVWLNAPVHYARSRPE